MTGQPATKRLVRVWFGQNVIAQHTAEPDIASRYEHAMRRRFASLRVTNDPVEPSGALAALVRS